MSCYASIEAEVAEVEARGLRRTLRPLQMTGAVTGRLDGADVTVFCSNDYLGLANHPDVLKAGGGAGGRLIGGNVVRGARGEAQARGAPDLPERLRQPR